MAPSRFKRRFLLPLLCALTAFLAGSAGCGQITTPGKTPGDACILQGLACSAIPRRPCENAARGLYQPFTCQSIGYTSGPCGRDAFGQIFAQTDRDCRRIRAIREGI